jgi:hypothetical protein
MYTSEHLLFTNAPLSTCPYSRAPHAARELLVGLPMPGVLALLENVSIGRVIDDILLMAQYDAADVVKDQGVYIPL